MHNFVNRVCNKCGILDTDPLDTPCETPCTCESFGKWRTNCPIHGTNGRIWPSESYMNQARGEVKAAMGGY